MREGLVRIKGEEDLFYDSIEKVYRYRMHCPRCGKISGCRCFHHLEDIDDDEILCCTNVCFVNLSDLAKEFASEMKLTVSPTMEEWNAQKIVNAMTDNIDLEYDGLGESCSYG